MVYVYIWHLTCQSIYNLTLFLKGYFGVVHVQYLKRGADSAYTTFRDQAREPGVTDIEKICRENSEMSSLRGTCTCIHVYVFKLIKKFKLIVVYYDADR